MSRNIALLLLIFSFLINASISQNIDAAEIEETVLGMNVSGNKEAPNLLYIIPWKDSSDKPAPPEIYRLMDEIYSTVDPDVFDKEVAFYSQLSEDKVAKRQKKKKAKKKSKKKSSDKKKSSNKKTNNKSNNKQE